MRRFGWLLAALAVAVPLVVSGASAPPRIVSLAPNLTELAYAAGAGPALVGTVEYSDYPDAARSLPRVGDGWRIDYERVLALRPNLVLAWASGTPRTTIERLRAMRLRVIEVETYRLGDVAAALRMLGALAGTEAVAQAAAARFESGVAALRAEHAGAQPLTVFVQIDDQPLFTVNGRHVISEVIALCGGRNVFAGLAQIAPQIDAEAVLAHDPQVFLNADEAGVDPAARWREWPQLTAVRYGTIYPLPADTVARATPRLLEGARAVCDALDDARRRLDAGR